MTHDNLPSRSGTASSAPDGAVPAGGLPSSVVETVKLLKRLGYPDPQEIHQSSALLNKVATAVTKRMGQLELIKVSLSKPDMAASQLTTKNLI